MAGEVSKEELRSVLMQAMMAAKNLRPQRDRLLHLQRRLQRLQAATPGPDDAKLRDLATDLFKVYYIGMEAGARMLSTCLELAVKNGGRFAMNPSFAVMPDEQLHDALLAQRLPARPTTQPEALARVEAALFAVKLPEEYHIPRCIEHLAGSRPPHPGGKHDTASPDGKLRTAIDLDKASDFLERGCTILSLAVKHVDLAVAVLSRFLDRKELASLADFTDKVAYISEDGPYPSTD
ncbi:hypothetical protein CFC21_101170 [Triticum aestivum]|uniref:Uncharacterized protein n=3 Tax=Triticum TaxID=4564 RepID=A0A9R0ZRP2_TRITD|nr:uncharacterized protein LOC119341408 [Triticum dicoccoides]XP_044433318.1 uncharacterized protein LOC123159553 [Triticum aestivum]KAF7099547.1 hypothetical protein CFC21_101170 [Triticum aestivum]VAI82880.1 unnamed protein product [Triticum turgidum subsp. durum]